MDRVAHAPGTTIAAIGRVSRLSDDRGAGVRVGARLRAWWVTSGLGGPTDELTERLPRLTLTILGYGFAFALPAVIMSAAYFGNPVSWMLSWRVADGYCNAATEGIGNHCFSDFQVVRLVIAAPSAWDNQIGGVPYLPIAMWPNVLVGKLAEFFGWDVPGSLIAFLVLVVAAAMVPAIYAAWKLRHRFPTGVVVALAGGMTWPVFSLFDRANVTAFTIPLILAFVVTLRRGPAWVAPVALVGIVMIRPQFLALGALLLVVGRWRHLVYAVEGAAITLPLSFIAWDSSRWVDNIKAWLDATSGFDSFVSLDSYVPTNLAASRSLVRLSGVVGALDDGLGDSMARFVTDNARGIGILILLVTIGVLFLGRAAVPLAPGVVLALAASIIFSSPTFVYYLAIALIVVVVVFLVPGSLRLGPGDRLAFFPRNLRTLWLVVTMFTTVLSLVPIPFAIEKGRQSIGLESAGPAWLLVWVVSLVVIVLDVLAARAVKRPAAPPPVAAVDPPPAAPVTQG